MSVSELYQVKPIAFRWTSTSTHDQLLFWVSWKVRTKELGEITRGVEIDWTGVQHGEFTPFHTPKRSKSQKEPAVNRKEVNVGFPSDYTLPCLPTSAVKTRPKELESVRWSISAATGHPKCAAALVTNLLHMVGIITDGASIAKDNTQPGEMRHDIDIVKELVWRQTHKGREIRRFGPYEHPGFLPRSSLDPGWWHWRRVFGAPWKDATEHINALELRALLAAVQRRLRVPANVHSKGLHISDSLWFWEQVDRARGGWELSSHGSIL